MATTLRPGRSHCAAVESNDCEAPSGFRGGAGYASSPGVRRADLLTCAYCCEPVCRPCSTEVDGKPVCLSHNEHELALWMRLWVVENRDSVAVKKTMREAMSNITACGHDVAPIEAELARLRGLVDYYEDKYSEAHEVAPTSSLRHLPECRYWGDDLDESYLKTVDCCCQHLLFAANSPK